MMEFQFLQRKMGKMYSHRVIRHFVVYVPANIVALNLCFTPQVSTPQNNLALTASSGTHLNCGRSEQTPLRVDSFASALREGGCMDHTHSDFQLIVNYCRSD